MTQWRVFDVLCACYGFTTTTMMMQTTRHMTAAAFSPAAAFGRRHFAASISAEAYCYSEAPASSDQARIFSASSPSPSASRPFFSIFYNDVYEVKLPPNHRFPMEKYRKVRERVQRGLLDAQQNTAMMVDCELRVSPLASVEELATTHSRDYIQRFMTGDQTEDELRNVGFPWSTSGVQRAQSSVGGTVAAAVAVCEEREQQRRDPKLCWGAHIAGGTHHAFYDRGEGFCVFSDIACAANVVLERFPKTVRRILILDLDVHQGVSLCFDSAVIFLFLQLFRNFWLKVSLVFMFSKRQW